MDEFKNLFSSLFDHAEVHEEIIKVIASKQEGASRAELEAIIDSIILSKPGSPIVTTVYLKFR